MLRSARRFGVRYGRKTKLKFAAIESEQRKRHKCPYCHSESVRRKSTGIWFCTKCDKTFTGRAYTVKFNNYSRDVKITQHSDDHDLVDLSKYETESEQTDQSEQQSEENAPQDTVQEEDSFDEASPDESDESEKTQ